MWKRLTRSGREVEPRSFAEPAATPRAHPRASRAKALKPPSTVPFRVIKGSMPRKLADYRQRDIEQNPLNFKATPRDGGEVLYTTTNEAHPLTPVLLAVFWSAMGAFSFGYHLGVVNGPLASIALDLGFAGDTVLQGMVVSSCLAGAAVGSLSGSGLADSLGRRKALLLSALPVVIGSLLSATASSLSFMVAGRLVVGIGIGLSSALVPLYISEVSPTQVRGTLGSLNQLVVCIGILFALLVNVLLDPSLWRYMFYIAVAPAVLLAIGMAISPESPRWLQSKGQSVSAMAGATKLWGASGPSQLDEGASGKSAEPVSLKSLLQCKGAIIGMALFAAQQLSGINGVVFFSSSTFATAGVKSGDLASALVGTTNVLGTVAAALLVDKFGRKQLLSLSFSGMGAAMLAMSAGLGLTALGAFKGSIALVGTIAYVGFFALGAGAVPGLLVAELTPSRLRGKAVSLALATHWVFNFSIGQLFLPAVSKFGLSSLYLFFAAVCGVTVLYTRSQVVETKGLSLEEIERQLS